MYIVCFAMCFIFVSESFRPISFLLCNKNSSRKHLNVSGTDENANRPTETSGNLFSFCFSTHFFLRKISAYFLLFLRRFFGRRISISLNVNFKRTKLSMPPLQTLLFHECNFLSLSHCRNLEHLDTAHSSELRNLFSRLPDSKFSAFKLKIK